MECDPSLYQQDPEEFYPSYYNYRTEVGKPSLTNLLKELINECKTFNFWRIKLW